MGKVQSDKTEKVKSFSCGGVKSLSVGDSKDYESHFKELNMVKFGEFMFGIRFAFEFFGYKAIPDEKAKTQMYLREPYITWLWRITSISKTI